MQDIVKRPPSEGDNNTLNLKTPYNVPNPHPSWVYSNNFNGNNKEGRVKRSLSLLKAKRILRGVGGGASGGGASGGGGAGGGSAGGGGASSSSGGSSAAAGANGGSLTARKVELGIHG